MLDCADSLSITARARYQLQHLYRATAQLTNYEGVQLLTRTPPSGNKNLHWVALYVNGEGGRGHGQLCKRV